MTPLILPRTDGIAGFTGTRAGITYQQVDTLGRLLDLFKPYRVHHGDCVGADETFHYMCLARNIGICIRPPTDDTYRAYCSIKHAFVSVMEPQPYITRNHDIVKYCSYLIACPKEMVEVLRSGTWATVRHAEKQRKPVYIIWPSGRVDRRPEVDVC